MTVPTTAAFTGPYFPNGVTVDYPFGFKVNDASEVALFYLEPDGTETIVPSSDYTVVLSSNENEPGGTVTTAGALPTDATRPLYVALDPDFTQNTKFEDEGAFNQSILNPTFDAGALRSIWLRARMDRALLAPFGETGLVFPRAAARANFFLAFAADGTITLSAGTGADLGLRQDLGTGDGNMIGIGGDATLADFIQWLTPAYVGVFADGDPDEDVTGELQALALAAQALKRPIRLDARKYVVSSKVTFYTDVTGLGYGDNRSLIQSSATTAMNLSDHTVEMAGRGSTLTNVRVDGNCSADPGVWSAATYDAFTGSRGIIVTAPDVKVEACAVSNVVWAGLLVQPGIRGFDINMVEVTRTRGNYGDGFIFMGCANGQVRNCRATDFTRIGFVTDTYGDAPGTYCAQISFDNCRAENGHHSSILFGGGEYNAGFWSEKSGGIVFQSCHAKDVGGRGFIMTGGELILGFAVAYYTVIGCSVDGAAEVGFGARGLGGVAVNATLTDCQAAGLMTTGFGFGGGPATDFVKMVDCRSILSGVSPARSSVKAGWGTTVIEDFLEKWAVTDAASRDAGDQYYASLGHFADAVGKIIVKNWKSVNAADAVVPSTFKFLAEASATLDLTIEDCYLRGIAINATRCHAKDVRWQRLGSMDCPDVVVEGGSDEEVDSVFSWVVRSTTKQILFSRVRFDFVTSTKWVALFNIDNVSPWAKVAFDNCTVIKNFETAATSGVVMTPVGGPAGALAATAGANHLMASDCILTNTGGATAVAAFLIDSNVDAGGKLHGKGNQMNLANAIVAGKLNANASFSAWG